MTGKIYLIAESDEDVEIAAAIIHVAHPSIRVVRATQKHTGGLSDMLKFLERSIQQAQTDADRRKDCVAVLRDEDLLTQSRRDLYQQVDEICRRYSVKRVIAVQHIEAWLLGNEGFCEWLGIKAQNSDGDNAKERLERFVRQVKKQEFSARIRTESLKHLNKINYSPSLLEALAVLDGAPCARP
ncbi:MAG: hypothetical protein L6Q98_20565 [Anaerolineae bacterium]|nr:hypothetical protein [Anaerolineae bacterium]NUQ03972.1 hypothetical protein [Anaerolineae bacterium]